MIRIENELSDLSWRLNTNKQQLQNVYNQMDIAKAEIGKPFPQEAELRQKSARLTELNALLDMDGKGSKEPVVDDTIVAKSSRPSVLDKLKAPAVHGTPGKPHKIEKEVLLHVLLLALRHFLKKIKSCLPFTSSRNLQCVRLQKDLVNPSPLWIEVLNGFLLCFPSKHDVIIYKNHIGSVL